MIKYFFILVGLTFVSAKESHTQIDTLKVTGINSISVVANCNINILNSDSSFIIISYLAERELDIIGYKTTVEISEFGYQLLNRNGNLLINENNVNETMILGFDNSKKNMILTIKIPPYIKISIVSVKKETEFRKSTIVVDGDFNLLAINTLSRSINIKQNIKTLNSLVVFNPDGKTIFGNNTIPVQNKNYTLKKRFGGNNFTFIHSNNSVIKIFN